MSGSPLSKSPLGNYGAAALLALVPVFITACNPSDSAVSGTPRSSRSYQGHENDLDADNFIRAFPSLVGTRLDDCQTCHSGMMEDGKLVGSACDNCHNLLLYGGGVSAAATLNSFGRDYAGAGRSVEALEGMKERDSDGDGFSNGAELEVGRYPGSGLSQPGQEMAPILTIPLEEIYTIPIHSQFMLANNTQQKHDDYVSYGGVTVQDLLAHLQLDVEGATGITVIAPDGYQKSLPFEMVNEVFPQPVFHGGLGPEVLGEECGLVRYPDVLPPGVADGAPIPGEHRLLLAFQRDGALLDPVELDVTEGKILGEGPLRLVVPEGNPRLPDRGSRFSPSRCGDDYDFKPDQDHNAGHMVRGVVAIRIDPMPLGVEEFDFMNGGWAYIEAGQLIIYGYGVR